MIFHGLIKDIDSIRKVVDVLEQLLPDNDEGEIIMVVKVGVDNE